ncbi:Skt5p [Rhizophagus irregularis DAOM 197198w]|uniref:Skt5p n=3 Tax=Rhizophagus irregularis TaxID=588596 RepID=A0A015JTK1_RHIIW|nr:Skt5p [Rhizophagus irregularis DAOM 197198w]
MSNNKPNLDSNNNINLLHDFFQNIKNFDKMDIKEIEPTTENINEYVFEGDLNIVINELVNLIFKEINEGKSKESMKKHVINYINYQMITLQQIYNWLLNNQDTSNSIYLFGYLNYHGIGTNSNKQKAIELCQKAAELENIVAQIDIANMHIYGKNIDNDYNLAFQLSEKLAKEEYASGINNLGYCYNNGIGTDLNEQKAFELYQKAADLGNSAGIKNLGQCYFKGIGTAVNKQKAFELFQKAADLENSTGISNLGWCYYKGIGTDIDKQMAFELYQKAANFGNDTAQYNIAYMYEYGIGVKKDIDQAIYWYKKSAEQEYQYAKNKLKVLLEK